MVTKASTDLLIREILPSEYPFLREMLYQAIFIADGGCEVPRQIIDEPELKPYIQDFGKEGDFCLVAEQEEMLLGAIWIRYIQAYGFVDDETPELSMAVLEAHRGEGIGRALLHTMIYRLKQTAIRHISLSVDKRNFAYNLYKDFGFGDYSQTKKSSTMVIDL